MTPQDPLLKVLFSLCSSTFVVILRKMMGAHLQIDPNVAGSLYFVFSKLTLRTIV